MKSELEGTWELQWDSQFRQERGDVKILSGGHFMFAAYEKESGTLLYAAGGIYEVRGKSYIEHMEFATEKLSALVGNAFEPPCEGFEISRKSITTFPKQT